MSWYEVARWLHIAAGAAWLGEVLVVVFVLVPALRRVAPDSRAPLLTEVFPRIFRLASVLVLFAFASGALLFTQRYGIDLRAALASHGGRATLAGALLGLALGSFHFVLEPVLERRLATLPSTAAEEVSWMMRRLTVIPRVGLTILVVVTLLMAAGARSW